MTESASQAAGRPFQQHGRSRDAVALALKNLLLNIVTLSLWRFWGKTRVRRLLWSNTTLWGDPLEYAGTGRELFLGFLIVVFLIFAPMMIALSFLQAMIAAGQTWAAAPIFAIQVSFIFLAGAGLYRAYRYRLTRTRWRGIRAGLGGKAWHYGLLMLWAGLASVLSLGWAMPWASVKLLRYQLDNTQFGNLAFECTARSRPLYGRFAVVWLGGALLLAAAIAAAAMIGVIGAEASPVERQHLGIGYAVMTVPLAIALIGLAYAWYTVGFYRELAANTRFDGHAFSLSIGTWPLIRLVFGNLLISLFSLGILLPWAALRTFRFTCGNLDIAGQPDFARVHQNAETGPRLGEGLAAVFDGAGAF